MHEKVIPDILILAKALGGGMPLGAFISSGKIMSAFTRDPVLGHLTTFGGHPVSCAAGLASFNIINRRQLAKESSQHEVFIRKNLQHPSILEIRGKGLMLAVVLDSGERVDRFFKLSLRQGLLFDYFLFCHNAIRVAPPLTISEKELSDLCKRIIQTLDLTETQPI
ncbi:MAG TPA: hypothetical protein DC042_12810 [Bacteroidales bacterium]|nr:hypothetical protein [Bacteroidales bacterium]